MIFSSIISSRSWGKVFFFFVKFPIFLFNVFLSVFRSPRNLNLRLGRGSEIGLMEGAQAGKSQSGVASSLTSFVSFF